MDKYKNPEKYVDPECKALALQAMRGALAAQAHVDDTIARYLDDLEGHMAAHKEDREELLLIRHELSTLIHGTGHSDGMADMFKYVKDEEKKEKDGAMTVIPGDRIKDIARRQLDYAESLPFRVKSYTLQHIVQVIADDYAGHIEDTMPGLRAAKKEILAERGNPRI